MIKHFKYLKYIIYHKWYVFIECCKLGIPLLGIVHDLSKFRPSEWFPYAEHFYGKGENDLEYKLAWNHHQHRNLHHPQRWVLTKDEGIQEPLQMKDRYMKEMYADWCGANKAIRKMNRGKTVPSVFLWYMENGASLNLHPDNKRWIEDKLHIPNRTEEINDLIDRVYKHLEKSEK